MPWPMVEDDIIKTQRSEIRGCKGDTKKKNVLIRGAPTSR